MPRYRENPFIVKFSMLCPGKSQKHQLTLYKGQVWRETSYLELCNHNVLNIAHVFDRNIHPLHLGDMIVGSHFSVPPVPGYGFKLDSTQIPWDSEILQSFVELTRIKYIITNEYEYEELYYFRYTYQLLVGSYPCDSRVFDHVQCLHPNKYEPWYIWTKEGLEIQILRSKT